VSIGVHKSFMLKLEIYIPTDSRFAQPVVEKVFFLSQDRQRHVWQGRTLTVEEFNEVADSVLTKKTYYKRPSVRVFEVEDEVEEEKPKSRPKPKAKSNQAKDTEELDI
jgi:hypothetical protein